MTRITIAAVFVIALAVVSSGCSTLILGHTALTPATENRGSVSLVVNNARPAEKGAENDMLVGTLRNLYGMPISKEAENSIVDALHGAFADALASAGYQVVPDAPTQVVVDITEFFMDGYQGYKITAVLDVKANADGAAVMQKFISKDHAFAYMSLDDLQEAYDVVMNHITQEAKTIFSSEEFAAVVR